MRTDESMKNFIVQRATQLDGKNYTQKHKVLKIIINLHRHTNLTAELHIRAEGTVRRRISTAARHKHTDGVRHTIRFLNRIYKYNYVVICSICLCVCFTLAFWFWTGR